MKEETKRILVCGLHDPMNTHNDVVMYDNATVDIDIVGNKAGMILALCHQAKDNPENFEDVRDLLNKIANGTLDNFTGEGKLIAGDFDSIFETLSSFFK